MKGEQLEQIRARVEAATPGPWDQDPNEPRYVKGPRWQYPHGLADVQRRADGAFIAHAREDVPALLADNERLIARETALAEALRELTDDEMVMGCDSDGARCCNGCLAPVGSPHTDNCPVTHARAVLAGQDRSSRHGPADAL